MAAAVAVQALASESYDPELSSTVWLILNGLMAVAVITAVVFSYVRLARRRRHHRRQVDLSCRPPDRVRRVARPLL